MLEFEVPVLILNWELIQYIQYSIYIQHSVYIIYIYVYIFNIVLCDVEP